jgi:hypothetical protein
LGEKGAGGGFKAMAIIPSFDGGSEGVEGRERIRVEKRFVEDFEAVAETVVEFRGFAGGDDGEAVGGKGSDEGGLAKVLGVVGAVGHLALGEDFGNGGGGQMTVGFEVNAVGRGDFVASPANQVEGGEVESAAEVCCSIDCLWEGATVMNAPGIHRHGFGAGGEGRQ